MKTYISLLLGIVTLLCSCTPHADETERLLLHADSLLDAARPDSALRLLQALPAKQGKLSAEASARYALLLARATDKCEKPLLPCNPLLDVALRHYSRDSHERAVALLYKGRLEVEMKQSERAIGFLLEGLEIVRQFPEEVETRRHLLSSLGNEYYDARLYAQARQAYGELYECCFTDKDRAIASHHLGAYYSAIEQKDSAFYFQHQALEYARLSGDSVVIAVSAHELCVEYNWQEQYDTALYYGKMALQWLPPHKKHYIYYSEMGNIFLHKENLDSATYYLNKSLEDTLSLTPRERAMALLDLSYIKQEKKDYQSTSELLYQFVDLIDSVYFAEQSTQIQELVHQYDIKKKIAKERRRHKYLLKNIAGGFVILLLVVILFFQRRINRRDRLRLVDEQRLKQAQERYANLQHSIRESQRIITLLREEQTESSQKSALYRQEIADREKAIDRLKAEKAELHHWLFRQSGIYKKVDKLAGQKASNKKELAVLSNSEQAKLKETVWNIYAHYISELKNQHPLLTDDDLLCICLEKAGLSNEAISFCFGNTDTHALAQRRYRMKGRMNDADR